MRGEVRSIHSVSIQSLGRGNKADAVSSRVTSVFFLFSRFDLGTVVSLLFLADPSIYSVEKHSVPDAYLKLVAARSDVNSRVRRVSFPRSTGGSISMILTIIPFPIRDSPVGSRLMRDLGLTSWHKRSVKLLSSLNEFPECRRVCFLEQLPKSKCKVKFFSLAFLSCLSALV